MGDLSARLRREIARWVGLHIVTQDQAERILALYPRGVGEGPGPGWAANLLHAVAGVLIGAAAIALILVGLEPEEPGTLLFVAGVLLALSGAALIQFVPTREMIGDALLVAGSVPMVPAALSSDGEWLGLVIGAAAVGALVWRHDRVFVQVAGVVAFTVAMWDFLDGFLEDPELAWLLVQGGLVAALITIDQLLRAREGIVPVALAVVALAVAGAVFVAGQVDTSEAVEIVLGLGMSVLIGIGVAVSHRGLVTGAVLVLSADAIAFGFDVGSVLFGTVVLLALAGVLLWQGERVRLYFQE